jgi:hypothetical protein
MALVWQVPACKLSGHLRTSSHIYGNRVNQELAGEKSFLPENLDGEASSRRALNKTTNTTNANSDPAMEYVGLVTLDMDRTLHYKCTLTTAPLSTRVGKRRRRM